MIKHNIVNDYLSKPSNNFNSFILRCCLMFDDEVFNDGEIKFSQDDKKYTFTKNGEIYYEEGK